MQQGETPLILYITSVIISIGLYWLLGLGIYKFIKKIKRREEAQKRLKERIRRMSDEERRAYYQEEANKAIIRMEKHQRAREWERAWKRR
ncbi:MAG: hypothetical protein Q4A37_01185 [Candidatus Saccharibacteria bacterium]|nr:hypothetical protein [Candidatus Saccharibacteria bacterium]